MPGMGVSSLLFSFSGRLAKRPFVVAVIAVYAASVLSHLLIAAPITAKVSIWPFALAQVVLAWIWVALHVKRLRDAGKPYGFAIGIACLYVLAVVLLILVVLMITAGDNSSEGAKAGQGLIRIFLVLYLFAALINASEFGVLAYWLFGFAVLLLLPVVIAVCYSVWATLPSAPSPAEVSSTSPS
jgi:uncharacterized membrane protein YhaH (DUF805 family)